MGFHPHLPRVRPAYLRVAGHESTRPGEITIPYSRGEQPIDWYPWGEEAFRLAAASDKPIFLSSGAIWCHWVT